jgi:hypothetical protein
MVSFPYHTSAAPTDTHNKANTTGEGVRPSCCFPAIVCIEQKCFSLVRRNKYDAQWHTRVDSSVFGASAPLQPDRFDTETGESSSIKPESSLTSL